MANTRVAGLREVMKEQHMEAIWITNDVNRRYLTGFTGSSGYVLITLDQAYLLTDFRYMTQAPEQAKDFVVVEHGPSVNDNLKQLLQEARISRLGFEEDHTSFSTYRKYESDLKPCELVPVSGMVEELRMFKDNDELKIMKEAADLVDKTFLHMLEVLNPGVSEWDACLELETFMRKHGASGPSFETIIASGERSALPHGAASSKIMQNTEFVTMDFGAIYNGYCSDITRTVFLGEPTAKHREIYDIVLEAQMHTLEQLKPGMTGREGDALARDTIVRYGYGDMFGHSTGHGLGMEVHEQPRLSKLSDTILKPGMVVTVEPGIYIPGFGGVRIEDDIVITDTGVRRLTESTKDFITL